MEEVAACVKSCIISRKGGIPISEFNYDFKSLVGYDVPLKQFGFKKLSEFLNSIDGVKIEHGNITSTSEKTKNLEQLINKQKNSKKPKRTRLNPRYKNSDKKVSIPISKSKVNKVPQQVDKCLPSINKSKEVNVLPKNQIYHPARKVIPQIETYSHFIDKSKKENVPPRRPKSSLAREVKTSSVKKHGVNEYINFSKYSNPNYIDFGEMSQFLEIVFNILQQLNFIPHIEQNFEDNSFKYTILNYEIVGDDCMLDFALRSIYMCDDSYYSSTCRPGLVLEDAMMSIFHSSSLNFLICCGSVDIHMGIPIDIVIHSMQQLLLLTILSGKQITVCTLPPSPNPRINKDIKKFNLWLCSLKCIQVIDLYSLFMIQTTVDVFDRFSVDIRGNRYFMWSIQVQKIIKQKIMRELPHFLYNDH